MNEGKREIETGGEEVEEGAPETPRSEAPEAPEPPTREDDAPKSAPESEPEPPPAAAAPAVMKEPSDAALEATAAMAQAAAKSPEDARAQADRIERAVLLEALSHQVPPGWLGQDAHSRLEAMTTPSLAMMMTWLSLAWWQGYAHGQTETVNAIRKAAAKGLTSERDKAALGEVEKEVQESQADLARAIEAHGEEPRQGGNNAQPKGA